MFVGDVVIGAHDAVGAQIALRHEPAVLVERHPAGQQIAVHGGGDVVAEEQVEREEAALVHEVRLLDQRGLTGVNVLGGFAEDEDRIGTDLEDCLHRQDRCAAAMLDVVDEADIAHQSLVPPAERGARTAR